MALPDFDTNGNLPPGLHAAPLSEVLVRFGSGSTSRQRQCELLRQIVEAAALYPSIKRVLVWGSFVTTKPEPEDLDYSIVTSVDHRLARIAQEHRRFFIPIDAHTHYGVDRGFLEIVDYPVLEYAELIDFICQDRRGRPRGVIEITLDQKRAGVL